MFQPHYLGNKKTTFLACNFEQVYAAILESSKNITIFFRTAESTLAGSMKFPEISMTWFLYAQFIEGCKCNA